MIREIRLFGDPILLQPTKEIAKIDEGVISLISDMKETLVERDAVGLAANQVGSSYRLFVLRIKTNGNEFVVLINPRIIKEEGKVEREEGCLSLPGIQEVIERPARIVLEGMDEKGLKREFRFSGILARAAKHEMDHLDGKLILNHLGPIRLKFIEKALERIREMGR